jgi:hypothetical protein
VIANQSQFSVATNTLFVLHLALKLLHYVLVASQKAVVEFLYACCVDWLLHQLAASSRFQIWPAHKYDTCMQLLNVALHATM